MDWKNVLGLIGLILLLVYGSDILEQAQSNSPFTHFSHLGTLPSRLLSLGVLLCSFLLAIKLWRK
ncbi:hypothetical protein P4B35_22790 [Pontiellaceae bacterium B12227]|nr:hypothetical protein [Pontiellaceae bacterium B12227]